MATPADVLELSPETSRALRWLFTDIDDTLTTDGLLLRGSFDALWRLHDAGISVVPVTGRPSGWCDHIARMWPVAAVIGENGAFCFSYDRSSRRMERSWLLDEGERAEGRRRLERIRDRVLREVPGAAVAADQPFRSADLAIDYCEDVAPLGEAAVSRICEIAREEGASAKVSSIHVNCWFGSYTKSSGVERFLASREPGGLDAAQDRIAFCGDSPNDEPMFERLRTSVAVANIRRFLGSLSHPPRFVTRASGGEGFAELADVLLARRAGQLPASVVHSRPNGAVPKR